MAEASRNRYEAAAAAGSAKALNGLGYEYFYGHFLPQNQSRAYGYFAEAARLDADGDSNFNAARFGAELICPRTRVEGHE